MIGSSERVAWLLTTAGALAVVFSTFLGVGGWIIVDGMMSGAVDTTRSAANVVDDVAAATDAATVSVRSMGAVVEDIESAARSSGRTLGTIEELVIDISDRTVEDVAASLDSAVAAMPGLIQTGRLVDRTLQALSLVGVDYDPATPLDEALQSLEDSLAPLPEQIRDQTMLLDAAADDLSEMSEDAGALAASLLEIRIELLDAEDVISKAATDVEEVAETFDQLATDFETYRKWATWLPVAAAIALAASGIGVLVIGVSQVRGPKLPGASESARPADSPQK